MMLDRFSLGTTWVYLVAAMETAVRPICAHRLVYLSIVWSLRSRVEGLGSRAHKASGQDNNQGQHLTWLAVQDP